MITNLTRKPFNDYHFLKIEHLWFLIKNNINFFTGPHITKDYLDYLKQLTF